MNTQHLVSASLDVKEKELLEAMAHSLEVPCNIIVRRLVRYFLDGKISWSELFGKSDELPVISTPNMPKKKQVRATLVPEEYFVFSRKVEEWGSTTSIVVKRLIQLYIAGKIERREIWY
jgi:hypothetical protein